VLPSPIEETSTITNLDPSSLIGRRKIKNQNKCVKNFNTGKGLCGYL
jgi:hypothetical protein